MDTAIQAKVNVWLDGNFDQPTKDEINKLQNENPAELADAFYRNLEFGTGGLRGIMGVGTNRMNKYTVGMATQGYANYLNQCFPGGVKVAIAHDCRNNSRFFAESHPKDRIFSKDKISCVTQGVRRRWRADVLWRVYP